MKRFSEQRPPVGKVICVGSGQQSIKGIIPEDDHSVIEDQNNKCRIPISPSWEWAEVDENPKDVVGSKKLPLSCLPWAVIAETAAGMGEGARKYGKHNYEVVGIRYSIYFDATLRHLIAYHLGEDIDPDSGVNHLTKAIASLMTLRDAQMYNKCTDDRPLQPPEDRLEEAKNLFSSMISAVEDCGKHYDRHSIAERQ